MTTELLGSVRDRIVTLSLEAGLLVEVPLHAIVIPGDPEIEGRDLPREADPATQSALTESIRREGILCCPVGEHINNRQGDKFLIRSGVRRIRAARELNLPLVRCRVIYREGDRKDLNRFDAKFLDLAYVPRARDSIEMCAILVGLGHSVAQVAEIFDKPERWVQKRLVVASLDHTHYTRCCEGKISVRAAARLADFPEDRRADIFDEAMTVARGRAHAEHATIRKQIAALAQICEEAEDEYISATRGALSRSRLQAARDRRDTVLRAQADKKRELEEILARGVAAAVGPGDVTEGAHRLGLGHTDSRQLDAAQIQSLYLDALSPGKDVTDPKTGKVISRRDIALAQAVAAGIARGETSLMGVLTSFGTSFKSNQDRDWDALELIDPADEDDDDAVDPVAEESDWEMIDEIDFSDLDQIPRLAERTDLELILVGAEEDEED